MSRFNRAGPIIVLAIFLVTIVACERSGDEGDGDPEYEANWDVYTDVTQFDLTAVWGESDSDVWVAGNDLNNTEYAIYHFDGETWDENRRGDDARLNAMWGTVADNVYAAGSNLILQYDGTLWSQMDCSWDRAFNVEDLWGFAGDDIFGVGWDQYEGYERALTFHFDGQSWEVKEMSGVIEENYGSWLLGVWGDAPDNVYAVGEAINGASIILHYNGEDWERFDYPKPDTTFEAVWGPNGKDIVVVGWGAEIYMKDGSDWSTMQIAINNELRNYVRLSDIWGFSSNEIYAAGMILEGYEYKYYIIVHYDGKAWSQIRGGPKYERVNSIWGKQGAGLFFVGNKGLILHYRN